MLSRLALSYRRLLARYYSLLIPVDASVLEVGCGIGELYKYIPGSSRCGIDLSHNLIDCAKTNAPDIDFIVGNANDYDFRRTIALISFFPIRSMW